MAKKKKVTGCPYEIALKLFGNSEDVLREQAPTRGAYYMWKSAGEVPWHAVGPHLLDLYEEATTGHGLVPLSELGYWLKELDTSVQGLKRRIFKETAKDRRPKA